LKHLDKFIEFKVHLGRTLGLLGMPMQLMSFVGIMLLLSKNDLTMTSVLLLAIGTAAAVIYYVDQQNLNKLEIEYGISQSKTWDDLKRDIRIIKKQVRKNAKKL